jgi:hypothetical protein
MQKTQTVEQRARRLKKWLAFSLSELESRMAADGGSWDEPAKIRGVVGTIRVVIRARTRIPQCWAMSILHNNARIDGIDWERVVHDHRGKKFDCTGWHRHVWKPRGLDTHKECLSEFSPTTIHDFVRIGCGLLNVELRRGDDNAGGRLQFD